MIHRAARRCVKCGHGDRIPRYTLERAAPRPRVVRRVRLLRVLGLPLLPVRRSRLATPAIRCTNRHCKCAALRLTICDASSGKSLHGPGRSTINAHPPSE